VAPPKAAARARKGDRHRNEEHLQEQVVSCPGSLAGWARTLAGTRSFPEHAHTTLTRGPWAAVKGAWLVVHESVCPRPDDLPVVFLGVLLSREGDRRDRQEGRTVKKNPVWPAFQTRGWLFSEVGGESEMNY